MLEMAAIERDEFVDALQVDFLAPRCWRALFASAGRECKAADFLRESGLRVYWPNYAISEPDGRVGGRDRRSRRLRSLISGYLFLAVRKIGEVDLAAIVETTPGLIGYMRDGSGAPAAIAEDDIRRIREIEAEHNKAPPSKHVHNFKIGKKIRFRIDPGLTGRIIEFCVDGRISVEAEKLLGGATVKAWPHQIEML